MRWGKAWRDAFDSRAVSEPPKRAKAPAELLATPEAMKAQVDAAYRAEKRKAKREGRAPIKYKSVQRRLERYKTGERKPAKKVVTELRRREKRRERTEGKKARLEVLKRVNREGGSMRLVNPMLQVSPRMRRGDLYARPRPDFDVEFEPGSLDDVIEAEERGDWQAADDAMTQLGIDAPYFEGQITGTDAEITDVGFAELEIF